MSSGNELFYTRLPVNEIPLGELLMEEHLFYRLPTDWYVIVTDIKDSTEAIRQGKHELVNLIATGSIVAVLNIAYKANLAIPYFFGGDGASFMVPSALLPSIIKALEDHQAQTQQNFNLHIRIGFVEVKEIYENNIELTVCKLRTSRLFIIPVVLGNGLNFAEKKIKDPSYLIPAIADNSASLDLEGMQCRWDLVKPPLDTNEVISLIVVAMPDIRQSIVFKKVIDLLDRIYGTSQNRQPITASRLKLNASFFRIVMEMKASMGRMSWLYGIRTWLTSILGFIYFRTRFGRKYLDRLIAMSDTLVMDGRINTVITGRPAQREELQIALDNLEDAGELVYGLSTSGESVMSCYVRNLNDRHVHFVDGAQGGYTRAAAILKKKLGDRIFADNEK